MRFLLPLILFCQTALAADKPLAEVAEANAKKLKAGGIAVGESIQGKVSYAAFPSPKEKAEIYNENVLFEIGSITKVFTGLLLAQAVLDNKVTLNTPISKLMDPKLSFKDPRIAAITLKQLSTHTSGLPRLPTNFAAGTRDGDPYAAYDEKLMVDFLTTASLKGDGPHPCSYSNLGVGLLGHLLGKVYGTSWEDAVIAKICQPLGLENTRMTLPADHLPLAVPHQGEKKVKSWHFDAVAGAGALRSNVKDILRFGQAMAKPESTPLAAVFALAMQPHAKADRRGQIGLGPFIDKLDGVTTYHHTGGTGGYRTALQVIPEKDIVRVVLINNTQLESASIVAGTRVEPPRVMPKEIPMTAEALQEYVGLYDRDSDSKYTLLVQDGQLWARITGQAFLRLFPREKDRFFYKAVNAEVHFERQKGRITALVLHQNGHESEAVRTDKPVPPIKLHTAEDLKPYTGSYTLLGLQNLTITLRGSTLYARLADQEAAPIFDSGNDRFEFDVVEAALTFNRDDQGRINGLVLLQNGMALPAARKKG